MPVDASAQRYRDIAAQLRQTAEKVIHPGVKGELLDAAAQYDWMEKHLTVREGAPLTAR
jgi:hypothetical protein